MTSKYIILKFVLSIQFLFFDIVLYGQSLNNTTSIHTKVQERTDIIFDSLVKIRRDFHINPEVSGSEKRTSTKIADYLLSLGLEVKTNIGGYGVVGILNTGKKGKRIAWRADIDAMPSDNPDVVDFPSINEGVRHVCGHDVNTTIALGIANVLSSQKEELTGTVYFIFQPAEEPYTGAKAMINDGLFEMISPSEIYGSHIIPSQEGLVSTKANWLFADQKVVEVSYKSSNKDEEIIRFTKEIISNLQNIEPDSKFWDMSTLADPEVGLDQPNTIFKDYITIYKNFKVENQNGNISISTYVYPSNEIKAVSIIPSLKKAIALSPYAKELAHVEFSFERAILNNDELLTESAAKSISSIYGKENVVILYGEIPFGRGDDFAYFQEQVSGVYFLLGGSNLEKGIISMPHSPNFQVDENCIRTGVNYFSSLIIERLFN
ncbi:M20 metallopeptidase family protein [Aquimarina celericrescens]|uniref:M20 family metallopeptidase n=1 Tax=Aquimarina celericrescens TaxID=1964542 RepID=A0ABW5B0W6_9FLAO|nr:M20/M25/M40 family metallo-hydrolase [Aquimarina celericrescens]